MCEEINTKDIYFFSVRLLPSSSNCRLSFCAHLSSVKLVIVPGEGNVCQKCLYTV